MSKLYTAISHLDELAITQEIHPAMPDIPFGQALEKRGSSLLRILVVSGALILFGLFAVGITAWWQDWFELQRTTDMASAPPEPPVALPIERQVNAPEQVMGATASGEEIGRPLPKQALPPAPLQGAEQQPFSPMHMADDPSATVISRLPAKALKKELSVASQAHLPMDSITEPKPLQLAEQLDSPVTDTASSRFIDQTAQLSRWLHQAEQRRRAGDWNGAIALFTKVWDISANPGVANNLAASLMQVGRLPEAKKILTRALNQAPDDQDLQQNLRVVKQLADK